MILRAALLLAVLTAAARDDPLAGRVAGPPQDCVSLERVQGPDIVDARTIRYRESGRRIWRTGPVGTCTHMRSGDTLVVRVQGNQLCRGDRFSVLRNGIGRGGICRFDRFVPYDKAR